MVNGKVTILSKLGLHLRPATSLCNLALNYPCRIELHVGNRTVNAKSVLGVLSACIKQEDEVELTCDGEQEQQAFEDISKALATDFLDFEKKE